MSGSRDARGAAAIDAANSADPNTIVVRGRTEPLALAHGRLAAEWIDRLVPDADDALRGHSLTVLAGSAIAAAARSNK